MSFIGQAEVTIDKKSRLAVPAKFRATLEAKALGPAWISMPREGGMLWLIPEVSFESLASAWGGTLIPDEDTAWIQRTLAGLSERVEMDTAGRVTLPKHQLELTDLDGDVMVIGAMSHVEIHARAAWQERERERLAQLPSLIAKLTARRQQG
ncbi:MAG: hypothetical protein IPJ41_04800 [Phycisphaerales bacterium]|nr:hypothetical protein [Phycisphaerales bacterium]